MIGLEMEYRRAQALKACEEQGLVFIHSVFLYGCGIIPWLQENMSCHWRARGGPHWLYRYDPNAYERVEGGYQVVFSDSNDFMLFMLRWGEHLAEKPRKVRYVGDMKKWRFSSDDEPY